MLASSTQARTTHLEATPYRFSPIEDFEQLTDAATYVVELTQVLAESVAARRFPIHYLTLFTHYQSEYADLCQLLTRLGHTNLTNNGIRASLHHPLALAGQEITELRVRRPDPYRMQVGCCDLDVPAYASFKAAHYTPESPTVRLVPHQECETLELTAPGFDVLAYVVGPRRPASQRFYRPLLHTVTHKPTITYPSNDECHLDTLLSRTQTHSVEDYVESVAAAHPALVAPASYLITIPWNNGPLLYLDLWVFETANVSASGPLVTAYNFAGTDLVPPATPPADSTGTASGDGLVVLGYEELIRRSAPTLADYLADPDRADELPRSCRADDSFYLPYRPNS
jgi:hypothetical protein